MPSREVRVHTYTVRPGDSLLKLAQAFHTSVAALAKLNHIANPNVIDVGEVLQIPDSFTPTPKMASHAKPAPVLAKGAHGPEVKQLQDDLVKLGYMTRAQEATGPGIFGPHTQAALEAFQRHAKVHVSGKYDAPTRTAMNRALASHGKSTPPTSGHHPSHPTTSAGKLTIPAGRHKAYDFFASFVKSQHGTFYTGAGQMNLIGFRKNDRVGSGAGSYSDVLYAVWKDSAGNPHVSKFAYNTEPAQSMTWDSNDANHDGKPDPGRIPTGFYKYEVSRRSNGAPCLRSEKDFKCERDVNHDGSFKEHFEVWGGDTMLFHQGGYSGTGSAGCQTFSPSEWTRFWDTVHGAHGTIGYTLSRDLPTNV
ncbi:MAG: peptidoglycan-binding protein [Deltaproteobacteria bacterium]|nr:peptidoglycan-binding protein [Deltaproteobacteria bacterium]